MSQDSKQVAAQRIVVVGGGYSAATLAVQLLRTTRVPLALSIIEPREHLGRGLAYTSTDPDHRLNGPVDAHGIDPDRPEELRQWCVERGLFENDPECFSGSGHVYLRRGDLGAYLTDLISRQASDARLGSNIDHVRDHAVSASMIDGLWQVQTVAHGVLTADLLVVATGNPVPTLRAPFLPEHDAHPRIIGNPLEPHSLDGIPLDASVLVVGGGLTALDVLSTFVRRGHRAQLLAISRRGLRPRGHARELVEAMPGAPVPGPFKVDLSGPVPDFLVHVPPTVRQWSRALRAEIRRVEQEGHSWHAPFDAIRDVVWKLWPRLPLEEQRRFLQRLGIYYDVHRFRTPPMNEQMVREAEQQGRVRFAAARLARVEPAAGPSPIVVQLVQAGTGRCSSAQFDWIVNCTGLDHASACRASPFLSSLLSQGLLRAHPTGLGFDVGEHCEARDHAGRSQPALRVIGPPTAGAFGDPLGAPFIVGQVRRIREDLLRFLGST